MLEKIKYHLQRAIASKQMRLACVAVLSAITVAVVTLLGNSIYTVNIFDGETTYTVRTLHGNVKSVLANVNLKSESFDIEETTVTGNTTTLKIAYTYPVYVTCGDKTTTLSFTGGTVSDALTAAGYTVDEFDSVQPSMDTVITDTVYIDYTDIGYQNGSYTETIPFTTETTYSADTDKGVTKTVQVGSNGLKEITYTEKLVNGVVAEKTVTGSTVLSNPVNAKKVIGTKPVKVAVKTSADVKAVSQLTPASPIELDAKGNPIKYKSKMTVRATAYTYTGNNCATGVAPKPGYIAVNPKVIPYGTKLYIKSPDGRVVYGYAVAADTGGFISKHPTGIDLFMSSKAQCVNFGVKNMEVYILE